MSKQMAINVTFKDSEKWIYDEIMKHSSHGGYIKDVLSDYLKGNQKDDSCDNVNAPSNLLDTFN